jgi:hypothetical protein
MRYRRLDANGDYSFGQGRANYATGREAIAQAVKTRLKLYLGEWWEDLGDGLPLWQSILGASGATKNAVDKMIISRITGTHEVNGIRDVRATFVDREYSFRCIADTEFGPVQISSGG